MLAFCVWGRTLWKLAVLRRRNAAEDPTIGYGRLFGVGSLMLLGALGAFFGVWIIFYLGCFFGC